MSIEQLKNIKGIDWEDNLSMLCPANKKHKLEETESFTCYWCPTCRFYYTLVWYMTKRKPKKV